MSTPPIPKDENNFYHPCSEEQIRQLVSYAIKNNFRVRVCGAGHSMPQAIFTDKCSLDHVDVLASAPDGDNVNIKLDRYTKIVSCEGNLVTVEAGIHLGHDPNDDNSKLENSLLYQLHHTYGLALDDLGGITHQTVAGFLSTGSSEGSVTYSIHENVHSLRFIDGNSAVFEVSRSDMNQDHFNASLVSLGLLGVLSRVTFSCTKKFNICGNQLSTFTQEAKVDIFNDSPDDDKRGLTRFLKETEYTRILWWPQSSVLINEGKDRVQVWQARRIQDSSDFKRKPFKVFDNTEIMMVYSYFMTLIGNIEDMDKVREIAASMEDRFKKLMADELMEEYGQCIGEKNAETLASLINQINTLIISVVTSITGEFSIELRNILLPHFTTFAIDFINKIDKNVDFQDHGYLGLPMDNSADDIIVPVMWTEIWVPLSKATQVTMALRGYFKKLSKSTFDHTGNNAWELYASKKSDAWLSMSYSESGDDWKDGAFRVDPYWFVHNSDQYRDMYHPIWLLLKNMKIPFRLHWGKSFPTKDDTDITAEDLVANQYPWLADFRKLREERDPNGIFLNDYWCHWLGINKP